MLDLRHACRVLCMGAVSAAVLAGCVVGPNYSGPPKVAPQALARSTYPRASPAAATSAPTSEWWLGLYDPTLDLLESAALATNPDVQIAQARLRASRAGLRRARAERLPTTGLAALYVRSHGADTLIGSDGFVAPPGQEQTRTADVTPSLELYEVGFDASWEVDLFGGRRRALEGAGAQAQAAEANLQDARVSLTAEVGQTYVQLRDLQAQIALTRRSASLEAQMLDLAHRRRSGGVASDLDVERLENQVETTRTSILPLQAQLDEALDRLAALCDQAPAELDPLLSRPGPVPLPPAQLAVGRPSDLLRRRPDVRAAERRIEQETALVGERTADLFPKVTLVGDLGFGSADVGGLLRDTSLSYGVAPVLHWSPLDFGRTRARIAQAGAGRDEALAAYRRTVLAALQEADTAVARYGLQREDLMGLMRVQTSAERAFALTQLRLQGGTATSLDVLEAERRRAQSAMEVARARALLTSDFVSLQKSLGLGWTS